MKAGDLRHRVIIQQLRIDRDAFGGIVEEWTTLRAVRAAIEPLRGREYWEARKIAAETTVRVRMRYVNGLLPSMRILHGERVLEIEAIIDVDGRGRELHVMCKELVL